jgi:hypothetical protein
VTQLELSEPLLTIIGHVLTLASIVAGVLIVTWQIAKQHRNSLRLQEEHLKNELRVKLYERLADAVEEASSAMSASLSAARRAMMPFELPRPIAGAPDRDAAPALSNSRDRVTAAITKLQVVMERYEIVFPGFVDMRTALGEEFKAFLTVHWDLCSCITIFLPMRADDPESQAAVDRLFPRPAADADIIRLKDLHSRFQDVCYNMEAYTADVRIEGQNVLLGRLFARTLPPRKPLDPSVKVLAPSTRET